jgi:hypothetical protein
MPAFGYSGIRRRISLRWLRIKGRWLRTFAGSASRGGGLDEKFRDCTPRCDGRVDVNSAHPAGDGERRSRRASIQAQRGGAMVRHDLGRRPDGHGAGLDRSVHADVERRPWATAASGASGTLPSKGHPVRRVACNDTARARHLPHDRVLDRAGRSWQVHPAGPFIVRPPPTSIEWGDVTLSVGISDPKALTRRAAIDWNGRAEPFTSGIADVGIFSAGIQARGRALDSDIRSSQRPHVFGSWELGVGS